MKKISIITATHNRAKLLKTRALSSLLKQTSREFEWIVINDGGDIQTRQIINNLESKFAIIYREIEHPHQGFGLSHARNLGLELATNKLVAYLDDDNCLRSRFVEEMSRFFCLNPRLKMCIPRQIRKREVWQQGKKIKESKKFISPQAETNVEQLVIHQQLFDSNGFTHHREEAPLWNPNYRIYCDYEYFLQCISQWGQNTWALNSQVLVEYIQTNQGVIGQSNLSDWALELEQMIKSNQDYPLLQKNQTWIAKIAKLQQKYSKQSQLPAAFSLN